MLGYSTEDILAGAKLRTMAPDNQFQLDDTQYLSLIDDELQSTIVPLMMQARENFFLQNKMYTITDATVLGFGLDNFGLMPFGSPTTVTASSVMSRAQGTTIKDIWYVDSNGKTLQRIPQLSFGDLTNTDNNCAGFYFESSKIVFHPIEQFVNKNIRIFLFRKPSKLIPSVQCATIVFKNTTNLTIQVDAVPAGWVIGTRLDILSGQQAFDSISDGVVIGSITGNVIELDTVSDAITSGDIVAPEYYAPVAQIPMNGYPLLMQAGAIKILETMKDTEGLKNAYVAMDRLITGFKSTISNRAQSNLRKLVGYGIWR